MKEEDRWLDNVRPSDWRNPEPAARYDLVVVGAGPAGLASALAAARLGVRVALVERYRIGGDCLNVGCVPSKAILRSANLLASIRDAASLGIRVPEGSRADFPAVMARMRHLRTRLTDEESAQRCRESGIDVFFGAARFSGPRALRVEDEELRFAKCILATGSRPAIPAIDGLSESGYLTHEDVFELTDSPGSLLVVGGGPLGCELAQAFCRLGCDVTIAQQDPQFLPLEERDAAHLLSQSLARDGVKIRLNTRVERIVASGARRTAHLSNEGTASTVTADAIVIGVGRVPNVEGLALESAGVLYDERRGVHVDDRLRTSNPAVYAAGDVCLEDKFTHTAEAAARIAVRNALRRGREKLSRLTIPWCTYTDPEIAHVGLYVREAREQGIPVETFTVPMHTIDRAILDGEEEGFVKIHVRGGTDRILGATIVARHAGEMINEITLAMVAGIGLLEITQVIHSYPTQAEAIRKAADAYQRSRTRP